MGLGSLSALGVVGGGGGVSRPSRAPPFRGGHALAANSRQRTSSSVDVGGPAVRVSAVSEFGEAVSLLVPLVISVRLDVAQPQLAAFSGERLSHSQNAVGYIHGATG